MGGDGIMVKEWKDGELFFNRGIRNYKLTGEGKLSHTDGRNCIGEITHREMGLLATTYINYKTEYENRLQSTIEGENIEGVKEQ